MFPLLAMLATLAFAAETEQVSLMGEKPVLFRRVGEALVSAAHAKRPGSRAMKALKKSLGKGIKAKDFPNPDGTVCSRLGGRVVIGKLESGEAKGFCRFGDGSIVDNKGLWVSARKRAGIP